MLSVRALVALIMTVLLAGCGGAGGVVFDPATPGVVWSRARDDDLERGVLNAVAVGGPGLVAVGQDRAEGRWDWAGVWVSEDGFDWTRTSLDEATFGGEGTLTINSVVAGGPGLVAVGVHGTDSDPIRSRDDGVVWVSPDGYNWTRVWDEDLSGAWLSCVTVGGPGLVAVGSGVWVSEDGYDWTRIRGEAAPDTSDISAVTAGGPGLVAVGFEGVWLSEDGYAWTLVDLPPDGQHLPPLEWGLVAGGPGLVAVGTGHGVPGLLTSHPPTRAFGWVSTDGRNWTRGPIGEDGAWVSAVAVGGPGLVAVGSSVWLSADGQNWSHPDDLPYDLDELRSVVAFGPHVIAVGGRYHTAIWVSPPPG